MEKSEKNNLRKFGITMGLAFLAITLLILARHRHNLLPALLISVMFFLSAFLFPGLLKSIYTLWMKLAFILGWINTRLILLVIFYLVVTPVGLVTKLLGIDLLDLRIDKRKVSYWRDREKKVFNPREYERQF
jgi:hypothetical protein